jgi:hypothetical protein
MSNGSFQKPLGWKPGKVEQQDSGTTRDWNKKTVEQQEDSGTTRKWNNKRLEQQESGQSQHRKKSHGSKQYMFHSASAFDQSLATWDTRKVTT